LSENIVDTSPPEKAAVYFHYAGFTDTGLVRDHNEDAYKLPLTDPDTLAKKGYLYVLADGMGGHQKGEVASAITIEIVHAEYYAAPMEIDPARPEDALIKALSQAIERANLEVMDATQGGGTTIVTAALFDDTMVLMNIGDSRAYLLRDGDLYLISRDHSLVARLVEMGKITEEEALVHPRRNVLYQALGQGSDIEIHVAYEKIRPGDIIFLCSDGLWGEVSHEELVETLTTVENPLEALQQLTELANEAGGPDNITTILVRVSDTAPEDPGYGSEPQTPFVADGKADDDDTNPSLPVVPPRHKKPDVLPESGLWSDQ
jgi:protein phosphatase